MFKKLVFQIKRAQDHLSRHWFKTGLFLMCFYVILHKDISFQISMHNGDGIANNVITSYPNEAVTPVSNPNPQLSKMNIASSIGGLVQKIVPSQLTSTTTDKPKPKEKVQPKPKPKKKDNKANHFHNISSIFSQQYLKKRGVSVAEIQQMRNVCKTYVKRFAPVAQSEMRKYGIPASIKLAQALLESDAGHSRLAKANSNHFGIKCFARRCKKSHCSNFTDDTHKDFFRKYANAWESFRAHSLIVSGKRYKHLKQLEITNYKQWAYGLKKAGYATDKRYAEKLIEIIEDLKLTEYDKI